MLCLPYHDIIFITGEKCKFIFLPGDGPYDPSDYPCWIVQRCPSPAHQHTQTCLTSWPPASAGCRCNPQSSQGWIPFARCDGFSSWLSLNAELLTGASCAIPWDRLWALWSQGSISAQKGFVLPTSVIISMCWHPEEGRTCPGLYRKQTISSIGNSHFSWHLSLRCTESCGSLENTWLQGNVWLNSNMSRLAKSFSYRVSSPSSFHFPSNPVPPKSGYSQGLWYLLCICFYSLVTKQCSKMSRDR